MAEWMDGWMRGRKGGWVSGSMEGGMMDGRREARRVGGWVNICWLGGWGIVLYSKISPSFSILLRVTG